MFEQQRKATHPCFHHSSDWVRNGKAPWCFTGTTGLALVVCVSTSMCRETSSYARIRCGVPAGIHQKGGTYTTNLPWSPLRHPSAGF